MLRLALIAVGVVVALVVVVVAVGYTLPTAHVASRQRSFSTAPERVFAALRDVEHYAAWRSDLQAVEVLTRLPTTRWRERSRDGAMTLEIQEDAPPQRLVTRIVDESLPFGGSWTFALATEGSGSRLTITEHGEIYNPLFRFMARFVFGYTATIEKYLEDLAKHLENR